MGINYPSFDNYMKRNSRDLALRDQYLIFNSMVWFDGMVPSQKTTQFSPLDYNARMVILALTAHADNQVNSVSSAGIKPRC